MFRIVGVVIDGRHRGKLVKAFDEHTLGIHVCESERPFDFRHSLGATVGFDRLNERAAHLRVVNEVNPSETHGAFLPLFVGTMVDDGSHAPHYLSVS